MASWVRFQPPVSSTRLCKRFVDIHEEQNGTLWCVFFHILHGDVPFGGSRCMKLKKEIGRSRCLGLVCLSCQKCLNGFEFDCHRFLHSRDATVSQWILGVQPVKAKGDAWDNLCRSSCFTY
jgi:hypothetical protein